MRQTIPLNNVDGADYRLTTEHAASSYGKPVLVAADGTVYGPGDALGQSTAGAVVAQWLLWARDMLTTEEQAFVASFQV